MRVYSIFSIVLFILIYSCKQKPKEAPVCPATIYGYGIPLPAGGNQPPFFVGSLNDTVVTFGNINITDATLSSKVSFTSAVAATQATWNESDGCYYVFAPYLFRYSYKLYRVQKNGKVDSLAPAGHGVRACIAYNKVDKKMYSIANDGNQLVELTTSGNTFSIKPIGEKVAGEMSSITIDSKTGDIYYYVADTARATSPEYATKYRIEKYSPGTASVSVILNGDAEQPMSPEFYCMQYNTNDNRIYAIKKRKYTGQDFVRLNPISGQIDTLRDVYGFSGNISSSCFDACSNTFIVSFYNISYKLVAKNCYLNQYSTSGELLHTNNTTVFYQGLASAN
jgi:hypothetical protein